MIDLDFSNFSEKHKEKFKQKNKHYKKGSRCVYVGQTSKHPTKRIKEHRQDGKSEKYGSKGSLWVK
ncbi:hypothetical protein CL643_02825, partial [bacterium]|nr:hypothetical protein [bacterium]